MRARAPGKLVLSGAYAVLRGAPALVSAVDRFVLADTEQDAHFLTPEVQTALRLHQTHTGQRLVHPGFDASSLREDDKKLGLGSSAAILVSCLEALLPPADFPDAAARKQYLYQLALRAHREAQGGGSGIDVAAATYGGTLQVQRTQDSLQLTPVQLPPELSCEVWVMTQDASTAHFVRELFLSEEREPQLFNRAFSRQCTAAQDAVQALHQQDTRAFLQALRAQHDALLTLGNLALLPIVLPVVQELHALLPEPACFLPAGAGGGDVTLYWGLQASPELFRERARAAGLFQLDLQLGAPGASRLPAPPAS